MIGLKFKNSISRKLKREKLKKDIIEKLNQVPDLQNLKMDIELALFVCRCIETEVKKEDKIVKKDLFIEIIQVIFSLNRDEVLVIEKQLEFLHENNKITKSKIINYVCNSVADWFSRKIL
jgi:hypothetical protein